MIIKDITTGLVAASGVSVSPSRLSLSTGQTGQLNARIAPSNATSRTVTWTSSDTEIATVNSNGLVTAISTGNAIITVKSDDGGFTAQATISVNPGATSYSTRLTGMPNDKYGLAKSLKVMPGDTIEAEVYAKYLDNNTNNWTQALTTLMTQIAQGTAPTGTFIDGGAPGSIDGTTFPFIGVLPRSGDTGDGPKAYLNYMIFDNNFVFKTGGFKRLSDTPKENGSDVDHEKLSFEGPERIIIKEPGYVYIYLSNENETPVEVYFDDFKVKHMKGPIVSSQDYYPFGLTFNSYQSESSVDQKFKFQGQEHIDDLDLGWDSFKWRNHQPDIGRFFNVDPLAEKYYYNSPYAFSENKVVAHVELEGLEAQDIKRQVTDKQNWNELGRGMKRFGNDFLKNTGLQTLWDGITAIRQSIPQEDDKSKDKSGPTITIIGNELNEKASNLPDAEDGSQNNYVDKALIDVLVVTPGRKFDGPLWKSGPGAPPKVNPGFGQKVSEVAGGVSDATSAGTEVLKEKPQIGDTLYNKAGELPPMVSPQGQQTRSISDTSSIILETH